MGHGEGELLLELVGTSGNNSITLFGFPLMPLVLVGLAIYWTGKLAHAVLEDRHKVIESCMLAYKSSDGSMMAASQEALNACKKAFTPGHMAKSIIGTIIGASEAAFTAFLILAVHFGWIH